MKIKVALTKSDGKYSPNRDPLTDCLVARALKRALKRDKIKYSRITVGLVSVRIDDKVVYLNDTIVTLIHKWGEFDAIRKDFIPPRISFTLEFN